MLRSNQSTTTTNNASNFHTKRQYKFSFFSQSIKNGCTFVPKIIKDSFLIAEKEDAECGKDPIASPHQQSRAFWAALLGIPIAIVGAVIGTGVGVGHGAYRVATRNPNSDEKLCQLFEKLEELSSSSNAVKSNLVLAVTLSYQSTKSKLSQSDSSIALFNELNNSLLTIDQKWQKTVDYMQFKNADGLYKNNGKRLFCIIQAMVDEYHQNEMLKHTRPNL